MPPFRRIAPVLAGLSLVLVSPVFARTYVVPHFIQSDDPSSTQYSFATSLQLTYVPGLVDLEAAPGATVDIYLFDPNGVIIESATLQPVCNPCSFALTGAQRRTSLSLYSQFIAAGGFAAGVEIGFVLIDVTGDADNVVLGAVIMNTHTSVFDFDAAVQNVIEVPGGLSPTGRLIVYPHVVEQSDPTTLPNAIDTHFYAVYAGGITGSPIPAGDGARVALYLFDDDGAPIQSATAGNVCAPCIESVDASTPRASFNLHSRFVSAGGFASGAAVGFAMAVITGNADAVAMEGLLVNSHTGAFDLSVAELESVELPYTPPPTSAATPSAGAWLRTFPNPLHGSTRIAYAVPASGVVSVEIVDVRGRVVARPVDRRHDAGSHEVVWNGRSDAGQALPSGVYFARLVSAQGTRVVKLTLLR
ncbi:MAG TPA: T9SS type A sorting domain-containing protein [Candidatus Krumholzibacteria bacterium]|nr:T9SS type A sorting domain-containing protein [Candidatus Krumholzibacteria bacterium]